MTATVSRRAYCAKSRKTMTIAVAAMIAKTMSRIDIG
jgi:hypothetical protein